MKYVGPLREKSEAASVYVTPFRDKVGHPIIVMHAGKPGNNYDNFEFDVKHVIYHLERSAPVTYTVYAVRFKRIPKELFSKQVLRKNEARGSRTSWHR